MTHPLLTESTRPGDLVRVGVAASLVLATLAALVALATYPLVDWGF